MYYQQRHETKCLATDMIRFDCYHKGRQIARIHAHTDLHTRTLCHMWHLSLCANVCVCVCLCSVCLFVLFALKLIDASGTANNPKTSKGNLCNAFNFHTLKVRDMVRYIAETTPECELQLCVHARESEQKRNS